MKTHRLLIYIAIVFSIGSVPTQAVETAIVPVANIISRADFEQKLGAQVPGEIAFRDEQGAPVKLGNYLGKRPAILLMGYSECPMLCSQVLNGLVEVMNDLRATSGDQFDLIDVSIDPAQPVAKAAQMKRMYFKRYLRAGADAGWHFLTGEAASSRRLADAVGFHYVYDPASKQYAHPSGFIVLTPEGKVSRYFFGVSFDGRELSDALQAAGAKRIGSPIERLLLLCFHSNPISGKYGPLIMQIVRAGGALTLLGLGFLLYSLIRRSAPTTTTAVAAVNSSARGVSS